MDRTALLDLLAWGGVRVGRRSGRVLVVEALDDFPEQRSDEALLAETGSDVRDGAALLAAAVGAERAVVVLPQGKRGAGDGSAPPARVAAFVPVPPAGAAPPTVRVEELRAPRLHSLGHPDLLAAWLRATAGFEGAAADDFIVQPAATAAAAAASARGRPRLDAWVTVSGRVRSPGTFLVPIGTPVATLLRLAGGAPQQGVPYVAGRGRMRRATASEGIDATAGSVAVLSADHAIAKNDARGWDALLRRADSACERCGACDAVCPTGVARPSRLLDALRAPRAAPPGAEILACTGCRLCEAVCPTGLGIGRIAESVAMRLHARGAQPAAARRPRLVPHDAVARRFGVGAVAASPRDARAEVGRVRLKWAGPEGGGRALRALGSRVWAGESVARGAEGEHLRAPFGGVVTHAGTSLTIRRSGP